MCVCALADVCVYVCVLTLSILQQCTHNQQGWRSCLAAVMYSKVCAGLDLHTQHVPLL